MVDFAAGSVRRLAMAGAILLFGTAYAQANDCTGGLIPSGCETQCEALRECVAGGAGSCDDKVDALDGCMNVETVLVTAPQTDGFFRVNIFRNTGIVVGGFPVLESVGVLSFPLQEEETEDDGGDSSSSSIDAETNVVLGCAESPSTIGHRSVFDRVHDALEENGDDRVDFVYGDTNGRFGTVHRDLDDWHRIVVTIDRDEIEGLADSPLRYWEYLAETMIHEAFHVMDFVTCRCSDSDEGHTYTRERVEYKHIFGVRGPGNPAYSHGGPAPRCLPS